MICESGECSVLSVCLTDREVQKPSLHDAKINYERLTLSSFASQFVLKKTNQKITVLLFKFHLKST